MGNQFRMQVQSCLLLMVLVLSSRSHLKLNSTATNCLMSYITITFSAGSARSSPPVATLLRNPERCPPASDGESRPSGSARRFVVLRTSVCSLSCRPRYRVTFSSSLFPYMCSAESPGTVSSSGLPKKEPLEQTAVTRRRSVDGNTRLSSLDTNFFIRSVAAADATDALTSPDNRSPNGGTEEPSFNLSSSNLLPGEKCLLSISLSAPRLAPVGRYSLCAGRAR